MDEQKDIYDESKDIKSINEAEKLNEDLNELRKQKRNL